MHADLDIRKAPMTIALLALTGLVFGAAVGAMVGIGAGLAWVEFFKAASFEGSGFENYGGMLVCFTFMPLGAGIGGLAGALVFGAIAARDAEIALEQEPVERRDHATESDG
jgi:hypothetical protein